MRRDIDNFIHHTCRCLKQRRPNLPTREPLQPIVTTAPLQILSIDFVRLERSSGGHKYILVAVDHFTKCMLKHTQRRKKPPLLLQTGSSMTLSRVLDFQRNSIMTWEGSLKIVCSRNFPGVMHSRTTPYHPRGNGLVERMNRTLLNMPRTLPETRKSS